MTRGRERVLSAITGSLGGVADRTLPQPAPMSITAAATDKGALASAFCSELAALSALGTVIPDRAQCATAIAKYLGERDVRRVAVQSSPLAADIASRVQGIEVSQATRLSIDELERADCGLLEAPALLADTGSAVVVLDNAHDRVLPYLPRTCVIVASLESLHETLTQEALACVNDAAESGARGEALIITGPSKSADIEKTLVLGAHGPEAVAIFIVEN